MRDQLEELVQHKIGEINYWESCMSGVLDSAS